MDIKNFFLRIEEAEMNLAFVNSQFDFDYKRVEEYLLALIAIPFQDYLDFINKDIMSPVVLSFDVPQFSNIDAAIYGITDTLSSNELKGYRFEEIGEMLQPGKTTDIVANKKYGENHVKTASDLGLCFSYSGRYFLSPIGLLFPKLTGYQQDQLISRFALRNNLVYTTIRQALQGKNVDIADEISFLSESTVKRRKNNCLIMCRLIQRNRDISVDDILTNIK